MLKVILINGIALSGKDTFVDNVENAIGDDAVRRISTIDPIKRLYTDFFHWDGEKTPFHREKLNMLKNLWRESCGGPLSYSSMHMLNASKLHTQYLFIMVREFGEMVDTKNLAIDKGYSAYTLQVVRDIIDIPPVEQKFLNQHPKDYKYDITINNPTTDTFPDLPEVRKAVGDFLQLTKYVYPHLRSVL